MIITIPKPTKVNGETFCTLSGAMINDTPMEKCFTMTSDQQVGDLSLPRVANFFEELPN